MRAYVVKVRVTEYDDYGKLVREVSDDVSINRSGWAKMIK